MVVRGLVVAYRSLDEFAARGRQRGVRARVFARAGCELIEHDRSRLLNRAEVRELVRDAHGYVPSLERVDSAIFEIAPDLRVVSAQGVGYDHIDAEEAARRGIAVCICAGANNHAVSELAFALMLNLARHIRAVDTAVREGEWPRLVGPELWGKTIGYRRARAGRQEYALIARGFGMRVLATDIKWDITFADQNEISYVPLHRLLRESDFLSLHCPLNDQTRGMIDEAAIEMMKPSAFLINTARGPIVKESALVGALRERMIAGAGLDVFEIEPHPQNPYRRFAERDPDAASRRRRRSSRTSARWNWRCSTSPRC